jgi:hypothetical protein
VRAGGQAIIWKAKGKDPQRGIVARAEVLTDPILATVQSEVHWVDRQRQINRVQVRYYRIPSILPLWDNRADVPLRKELSVARAAREQYFNPFLSNGTLFWNL